MLDGASIFVVVPAHNEERLITRTLGRMPPFVDHIVVVDDASSDDTSGAARSVGDARVHVVRHPANRGVGAAIATGYRFAQDHGADVVAVMAGDDQMHPDDLAGLIEPILRGKADYVKGDRLSHPDVTRCMPRARRWGSVVLSACTRVAVGAAKLSDSQCGYTAISRSALAAIDLDRLWPRFGYPNDLLGLLCAQGLRVVDVVVRPVYADERSELRVRHVAVILGLIARAAWRVRMRQRRATPDVVHPRQEA